MSEKIVLFGEEDTIFRFMETALNGAASPKADKALHYYFPSDIQSPRQYLTGLPALLGMPSNIKGVVCGDKDSLDECIAHADFLVVERASVTRRILKKNQGRLKFIQKFGLNCQNIDLQAAKEMGIPVASLSRVTVASVAEHTILFILALSRNLLKGHFTALAQRNIKDGSQSEGHPRPLYNWGKIPNIQLVGGRKLGIIGLGEIGIEVAKRSQAIGMIVHYYDSNRLPKEVEERTGIHYVPTLMRLMEEADFVTVHVPSLPSTRKLVNTDALSRMKPSAFFINTSRGELVDEEALFKLLSEKKIMGAGLDVYSWEPIPSDCPLLTLDNVLWSNHNAGGPPEFILEEVRLVLQNLVRVLKGEEPENRVISP